MSTSYRVAGRGARLTEKKLRALVTRTGGRVLDQAEDTDEVRKDNHLCCAIGGEGFLHFYNAGRDCWNQWERFGGNGAAADLWQETLEEAGYTVLSEYDEGFFK